MYIWVILATFMVALYSFNLAYRSDLRSVQIEPVARALISKLIIKQQAAAKYVKANTPPYAQISAEDGTSMASDTVTYGPGIIATDQLTQSKGVTYLPFGFKDDGTVTTEIYCVDKNNPDTAADCGNENASRYLVSYMVIPQRWLNVRTGMPNNDFNRAVQELIGNDSTFGYPICKDYIENNGSGSKKCDQLVIKSRGDAEAIAGNEENMADLMFQLPVYISKNGGFARTCNDSQSDDLCLMNICEFKAKYYK